MAAMPWFECCSCRSEAPPTEAFCASGVPPDTRCADCYAEVSRPDQVGEREALLAGVVAGAAADLPRLVYADHLDERGDWERARFIRLQVAAEGEPEARRFALWGEAYDLAFSRLGQFGSHFTTDPSARVLIPRSGGDVPEVGQSYALYRRGFLDTLSMKLSAWAGSGDLLSIQPVMVARATDAGPVPLHSATITGLLSSPPGREVRAFFASEAVASRRGSETTGAACGLYGASPRWSPPQESVVPHRLVRAMAADLREVHADDSDQTYGVAIRSRARMTGVAFTTRVAAALFLSRALLRCYGPRRATWGDYGTEARPFRAGHEQEAEPFEAYQIPDRIARRRGSDR